MVQFLAQGAPRQIAVYFALTLAMTAYHNAAGHMGQIYAVIRLIDLLASLAAAAHKLLLQVIPMHTQALHHILEFL
jgi:hypothetical protein